MPKDVFDHDHGRVHDDAEVNRPHGEQIGRMAAQHHNDDAEEERHRDGGRDNDGAAKITQEEVLNAEDKEDAEHHVMEHCMGGDVNQIAAVIEGLNLHAGGQHVRRVDLLDLRLNAREDL